jgi:hypothetical protein
VDWGITTTPNSFSGFIASGTASVVDGAATMNLYGDEVSTDTFSLPNLHLAAGNYYLVLQNAQVANGDAVFWDESDGLSTAVSNILGQLQGYTRSGLSGSESFSIMGGSASSSGTPEPASWVMMLLGFAGLGAARRAGRTLRRA